MAETEDKKIVMIKNVGIATGILLAGIGYFIGFKRRESRDVFVLKSLLQDAINNGPTELFWDNDDGTSLKFLIDFVE